MKVTLIAALLAASMTGANAEDGVFAPTQAIEAVPLRIGENAIDVRGLTPGMPMAAAASIIRASFPRGIGSNGVQEVKVHFGVRKDGVVVTSTDFVNRIHAYRAGNGQTESLRVDFSGPASGNQLIGLMRGINFRDDGNQPSVVGLIADLKAKYGNPTVYVDKPGYFLTWQYVRRTKMTSARFGIVETPPYDYSIASMNAMLHPKVDDEMTIKVQITTNPKDPTLVALLEVTAGSHHLRNVAAKADAKAMLDEVARRAALPRPANHTAL